MLKKALCSFLIVLSVSVFYYPSFATGLVTSYISEGLFLTDPLKAGKADIGIDTQYVSASKVANIFDYIFGASDSPEWVNLNDSSLNSISQTVTALKISYGFSDKVSLRITIPYVSTAVGINSYPDQVGQGLSDVILEGLYGVREEKGGSPFIGLNFAVKPATGRSHDLGKSEFPQGTGSTNLYFSGIIKKSIGAATFKGLLGYAAIGNGEIDIFGKNGFQGLWIDGGDEIFGSLYFGYAVSDALEIGAELWGSEAPKEIWGMMGASSDIEGTETSVLYTSFSAGYKATKDLTLGAALDLPFNVTPSFAMGNGGAYLYKGTVLNLKATWNI